MASTTSVTYQYTPTTCATSSGTTVFVQTGPLSSSTMPIVKRQMPNYSSLCDFLVPKKLPPGERIMELPDGSKLVIDKLGNYQIEDKDAKVTYKANRIREFSPYLNASDMLAKFVEYLGKLGVKQAEVLGLPLELFINWLIIEAAERDQDPIPANVVRVEHHLELKSRLKPKCLTCGKYIIKARLQQRFPFCNLEHGISYARKRGVPYTNLEAEVPRRLTLVN